MEFGRSVRERVEGIEHHVATGLEGKVVSLAIVAMGLLAPGSVEVFTGDFMREPNLLYEIAGAVLFSVE